MVRDCRKCGSYVPEGKIACPVCGRIAVRSSDVSNEQVKQRRSMTTKQHDTPFSGDTYERHKYHNPHSEEYRRTKYERGTQLPKQSKRILCAAAYFWFFFFLPLIALPGSKEAKFHANQGLVLFLYKIIISGLAATVTMTLRTGETLGAVFDVLEILYPLLMVYGAANAYNGKMIELPLIGKIKILKSYDEY